jgi:hypothetical protein
MHERFTSNRHRPKPLVVLVIIALTFLAYTAVNMGDRSGVLGSQDAKTQQVKNSPALSELSKLAVKGRAPKTGYEREQFGSGWAEVDGCDMRNYILQRDLTGEMLDTDNCKVLSGVLRDPYTTRTITFTRGATTSNDIQIDHVVALSDAWQTGAQSIDVADRAQFANDPLNLLAVDGPTNESKGDSDAASWLPPDKDYRCSYVARQVAVKEKYKLWVTLAEHDAMKNVLATCPAQQLPRS